MPNLPTSSHRALARKALSVALAACLACLALAGCASSPSSSAPKTVLRVAAPWADLPAFESAAASFTKEHPNITLEYEFVQDYDSALPKRLAAEGDESIDLFISGAVKADSPYYDYAYDLNAADSKVDLSQTFPGLIQNFSFTDADGQQHLMTVPLGGEVRGLYVNKSLLESLNLSVPANRTEFLDCCAKLKDAGYVALQGNPGLFAQQFLYPYCCSLVTQEANATAYAAVAADAEGVSSYFADPMSLLYGITENGYYNYKYVETTNKLFTDVSNQGYAESFFNVVDGKKVDDKGTVPFMASVQSLDSAMQKCKADYDSSIDYEFILAPVTDEGGIAYLSPTQGLSVNKSSQNLDAALEFMNWFYQSKNNTAYAQANGTVPNTTDAMAYLEQSFDVPQSQTIELGQATFDYPFYTAVTDSLVEVCKGNNPKYMNTAADGTQVMYGLDYYMANMEARFAQYRTD